MTEETNIKSTWNACTDCQGRGKKRRRIKKKVKLQYQQDLIEFEKSGNQGIKPEQPRGHLETCDTCKGTGLLPSQNQLQTDTENYPHVAIIGGGIGGTALAVACLHRGIPFTLYERDENFEARSQGYGLTLQQASKAIQGLGITKLQGGVVSTKHVVHTTEGKIIGEWGIRKWMESEDHKTPKKTNIHIARQSLRRALLQQLEGSPNVKWGHQLTSCKENTKQEVELEFLVQGEAKQAKADLVVGADGIRSRVRQLLINEEKTPLRYLDCIVILGICPLSELKNIQSDLLDSATVFQTANGNERIYVMPFDAETVMWQLSFPMKEEEAKKLSSLGTQSLKQEAIQRTQWHSPIPEIVNATQEELISGYPVYDRELLTEESINQSDYITLLGDAAHPMSPFKGQGANQALLDALSLARGIRHGCRPKSEWKTDGIRKAVLNDFEKEMLERSAVKVKDSAAAAQFLHTDEVLREANEPRGKHLKKKS